MWIQISSGRGPMECSRAVMLFLNEFVREIEKEGYKADVLEIENDEEQGTAKSALISTNLESNHKILEEIEGTVLWICKSPYRPNHLRKNWYIDVEKFIESEVVVFSEKDIKIETMKSSGAGGQNVNKVETAVKITHLETGLSAIGREERSQLMNKKLALVRLKKLIENIGQTKKNELKKELWGQHNSLERGNPSRTYVGEKFARK